MIEQTEKQLTKEEDINETITIEKRHLRRLRKMIDISRAHVILIEGAIDYDWMKRLKSQLESASNFAKKIEEL